MAARFPFAPVALLSALILSALVACGGPDEGVTGDEQDLTSQRIRLMEGNLSSGNQQSYLSPGSHIFAGLHPDVALVQEFNVGANSKLELDTWVKTTFGPAYSYFRESSAAFQIPNGVVSRFPILASGSITDPKVGNRAFAYARLQLPDGSKLWAFSLHLLTKGDRDAEAAALVKWIKAAVPAGDHVVIGGDFNTGTRTEPCVLTLGAVVSVVAPFPVDNQGNEMTSGNRSKPHDWLLVDAALRARETPVAIKASRFPSGLVVDTRVYSPILDLSPAVATDSGAPSMQHMGVVRDFLLPVK